MNLAPKLKKGDSIGIVVPSNRVTDEQYLYAQKLQKFLENIGFQVISAEDFQKTDYLQISGGEVAQRVQDINEMIQNPEISCIWFFQGGDTANQLVEYIDYESIKKYPKIFIGKSDCDLLLSAIYSQTGLITFHGCDAKLGDEREMDFPYTQQSFTERFMQGNSEIKSSGENTRYMLKPGKAKGTLFGCNLKCLLKLNGTEYLPKFDKDFIFFIEGYRNISSHVMYLLEQFRMLGVLQKCRGVVVGHFFDFDGGDFSIDDVVLEFFKDYDIPIMKTNEFGHYQPHTFLPIGAEVSIDTETLEIKIESEFLE